ncbi:MAG TPA: lytic transglycosylase domain-containing protein [Acidimicrobiales bacterium]|nr:lytic transglycosylase domain-containing protein [Acidimicrobiales bacterium]
MGSDEAGRVRAQAELATAQRALRTAQATQRRSEKALEPLRQRLQDADNKVALLSLANGQAATDLVAARDRMKKLAVAGYVTGSAAPVDYLLRARDPQDLLRRNTLVKSATEARKHAVDGLDAAKRAVGQELEDAIAARDDAAAAFQQADTQATSDAAVVALLEQDIENKRLLLDLVTAAAPVDPSDIPRLFLDAYRNAAGTMWRRAPACRVPWTAVAALGKIESNHGRYRDSQLALNGDVWPRILGIPLDGTRSAAIPDTDMGVLDGDPTWDRAVGPMQFIPSTWKNIGIDGNADGIADPNNAYDAALSTALYLCRAAPQGNLDTDEAALRQAFFSYNHSDAYVDLAITIKASYDAMADALPASPVPH